MAPLTEMEKRAIAEYRRRHPEQTPKPTMKEKITRFVKGTPEGKARQERIMREAKEGFQRAATRVATGATKFTREEIRKRYIDYEKGRVQRIKKAQKSGKRWSPGYQRKAPKSRNPETMREFGMDMNVFEPDRGNRPERMHEPKSGLVNILADHSSGGMLDNGGFGNERKERKSFLESW